jgi:hypothetical protein
MRLSGLPFAALAGAMFGLVACSSGENNNTAGTGGSTGSGGAASVDGGTGDVDNAGLTWRPATLTDFESFPAPNSVECIQYMGCQYQGMFAAFPRAKTEQWVMDHNIASVHEKDFLTYVGKTLRVRQDGKMVDAVVYDECIDTDCNGCCTRNAMPSGFLIDLEKYTFQRMGGADGPAEWACIDCN